MAIKYQPGDIMRIFYNTNGHGFRIYEKVELIRVFRPHDHTVLAEKAWYANSIEKPRKIPFVVRESDMIFLKRVGETSGSSVCSSSSLG